MCKNCDEQPELKGVLLQNKTVQSPGNNVRLGLEFPNNGAVRGLQNPPWRKMPAWGSFRCKVAFGAGGSSLSALSTAAAIGWRPVSGAQGPAWS